MLQWADVAVIIACHCLSSFLRFRDFFFFSAFLSLFTLAHMVRVIVMVIIIIIVSG